MFHTLKATVLSAFVIAALPITAHAEADLCNKVLPRDIAVGDYKISRDPSVIKSVKDVPFPGTLDSATITLDESGHLVMQVQGSQGVPIMVERQKTGQTDLWGVIGDHITDQELERLDIMLCPLNKSRLPNLLQGGYGQKNFGKGMSKLYVQLYVNKVSNGRIHANGDLRMEVLVGGTVMATYKTAIVLTPN